MVSFVDGFSILIRTSIHAECRGRRKNTMCLPIQWDSEKTGTEIWLVTANALENAQSTTVRPPCCCRTSFLRVRIAHHSHLCGEVRVCPRTRVCVFHVMASAFLSARKKHTSRAWTCYCGEHAASVDQHALITLFCFDLRQPSHAVCSSATECALSLRNASFASTFCDAPTDVRLRNNANAGIVDLYCS